jgi:hypothetical protein
MPVLHYGSDLRLLLDAGMTRQVMEAIGAHASRGGWVTVTDRAGRDWSFLVTAGVPIWMTDDEAGSR